MPKAVLLCVDERFKRFQWPLLKALQLFWEDCDELHVVSTAASAANQKLVLQEAIKQLRNVNIHEPKAVLSMNDSSPCATGGELVEYAHEKNVDIAILCTGLQTLLAQGCILAALHIPCCPPADLCSYVSDHVHCPVLTISHHRTVDDGPRISVPKGRKVCIAFDGSSNSRRMLQWASDEVLRKTDEVHVINVGIMKYIEMMAASEVSRCPVEGWREDRCQ